MAAAPSRAPPRLQPNEFYELVLNLTNADKRQAALVDLSTNREAFADLAPILWHSVCKPHAAVLRCLFRSACVRVRCGFSLINNVNTGFWRAYG